MTITEELIRNESDATQRNLAWLTGARVMIGIEWTGVRQQDHARASLLRATPKNVKFARK